MKKHLTFLHNKPSVFYGALVILFSIALGGCSAVTPNTKDAKDAEIEAVTEAVSGEEICLRDLQANGESFMMGHNDSGHGVIYYLYRSASEDHLADKDHYYLLRYETDLLTETFWNGGSVAVHSGQKGEINGVDWNTLWTRFYTLYESEKNSIEESWKQGESVGVWGTVCERPIIFKLSECSEDYRNVTENKDKGILSLFRAEYEILGTKKQLIGNGNPSDK